MLLLRAICIGLCLAGLAGEALAVARDTMAPGEIATLQRRLIEAQCYPGPIDGTASAELTAAQQACPDQDPMLRIETGMHTAAINRIGTDAACTIVATASEDKSVRLWSMPDGRLLRTERLPIGAGNVGKVYAVAVSPNGSLVAAGGWMAGSDHDGKDAVYLFDAASGQNLRRIGSFEDVVVHLAFSPDGQRLAVALGSTGIRVLDVATGREIMADRDFSDQSYAVAFGPDGALYATGLDGFIRRYDANLMRTAKVTTQAGQQPSAIAVDPSGERLAVGFYDSPAVALYDAQRLKPLAAAETGDLKDENLNHVAWSRDGTRLIGGGRYGAKIGGGWRRMLRRWTPDGRRGGIDVPVASNTIMDLALCGDAMAFAAGDPAFGLLKPDGTAVTLSQGHSADLRGSVGDAFTASADGTQVRFGLARDGAAPVLFDLAAGSLVEAPQALADAIAPRVTGLDLEDWEGFTTPSLKGQKLALDTYEISRSLAIRPGQDGFVLGAQYRLRAFDAAGHERWKQSGPSEAWGVNLVQDGAVILAAYGDGTIRWHRWSDGAELLALFVDTTNRHWVAWTPSGYYMASPGGEDLIGWQVNRGWEQQADFFPASRFSTRFNRPDIVRLVLKTLDEAGAIGQANAAAKRHEETTPISATLPPVVTILSPAMGSRFTESSVELNVGLRSPSGLPIDRVDVLVDGRPVELRGLGRSSQDMPTSAEATRPLIVPLPPHDVEISVIARSGSLVGDAAKLRLTYAGAPPQDPAALLKPKLYVVAIGVSDYVDPDLRLGYAAADAKGFAETMAAQKGGLYADVEVKTLVDRDVTRSSVVEALAWLDEQVTSRDFGMVLIAGHGHTDDKQNYWFVPSDATLPKLLTLGVSQDDILRPMRGLAGKALLFIDTCRANQAVARGLTGRSPVDMSSIINELTKTENGLVVFSSSQGRELSEESAEWQHGAFTKALIEGLGEGKADLTGSGTISISMLDAYIAERVKKLTGGLQHPVMSRPPTVGDFTLALVRRGKARDAGP